MLTKNMSAKLLIYMGIGFGGQDAIGISKKSCCIADLWIEFIVWAGVLRTAVKAAIFRRTRTMRNQED